MLLGTKMELWVFDRSGLYSSGPFDIYDEPEKFIRSLVGYTLMSDDELGLDIFIVREGQDNFITIQDDATKKDVKIQLEQQSMIKQRAIIYRRIIYYRSKDDKSIIKFSWLSDLRSLKIEYFRRARDREIIDVASLFGYYDITSIEEIREGVIFPSPYRFRCISLSASILFSEP